MFKLEWFNYRQEVCEVNSSLQYNCYYLVKNNLGRNFYNQILLNCKFFIANYTSKSRQVFSEVNLVNKYNSLLKITSVINL